MADISNIINKDKSDIGKQFVKRTTDEIVKSEIIKDGTPKYTEPVKITGSPKSPSSGSPGVLSENTTKRAGLSGAFESKKFKDKKYHPIRSYITRSIEDGFSKKGNDGDVGEKAAGKAASVLARAPRYTKNISRGFAGTVNTVRYMYRLRQDIKNGVITGKEAKIAALGRGKAVVKSGAKAGISAAERAIENFHGSDDLGIQTITKPKDMIYKTRRAVRAARYISNTPKRTMKSIQNAKRKAQQVAKAAAAVARTAKRIFTNPLVIKGILILAVIAILILMPIALVSSVTSIFSNFTFVSPDQTLTDVSTYVSKLDAEIEYEVVDAPNNIKWAFKDVITTTINMKPQTDVEKVISYLTVKYGDFKFDDQITAEINEIVKNLYTVTYKEWDEVKHHNGKDPFGNPTSWNETIHHLDITLDGITLDQYLEKNKDTLFVNDEYSRYLTLADVGGETFRVELGSPFMGQDWESLISSRFGWRIHPITKKLSLHEGLDIAMPAGTQINAVMDGTVTTGYEPEGLGKYIVVTNGDISTKYGHCSKILVTEGTVKKGDVIALVGSTGSLSTGDHLHLEYTKNGINLNPLFYLEK